MERRASAKRLYDAVGVKREELFVGGLGETGKEFAWLRDSWPDVEIIQGLENSALVSWPKARKRASGFACGIQTVTSPDNKALGFAAPYPDISRLLVSSRLPKGNPKTGHVEVFGDVVAVESQGSRRVVGERLDGLEGSAIDADADDNTLIPGEGTASAGATQDEGKL